MISQEFWIGLVGAAVGGTFALGGTWLTLRHEEARERRYRLRDRLATLRASVFETTHYLAMKGFHPHDEWYQDWAHIEQSYANMRAAAEHLVPEDIDHAPLHKAIRGLRDGPMRAARRNEISGARLGQSAQAWRTKLEQHVDNLLAGV